MDSRDDEDRAESTTDPSRARVRDSSARDDEPRVLGRRGFLATGALVGALPLAVGACARAGRSATDAKLVRVATVSTPVDGGLLPDLAKRFEAQSGLRVELTVGEGQLYDEARAGRADLVISHYGHKQTEAFVMDGLGAWPRTLFSNQLALFGPRSDPAAVSGLTDATEAFGRIARARAPFVVNDIDGVRYLTEILWHAAGSPARDGGWFLETGAKKVDAIALAAEKGAYTLWGLTPFLREQKAAARDLAPLVVGDPILQRLLVSIVVSPGRVAGVNDAGARAFESFLLEPSTQARIHGTRYPGAEAASWAPAGRHNRTGLLPKV